MNFDETLYEWSSQGPLQVVLFVSLIRLAGIQGGSKKGQGGSSF